MPKPASLIHSPLYFIVSTEQWESSKTLEERQSGCCELPSLGSSLCFFSFHGLFLFVCFSFSPGSVQLPVVSIMKEVVEVKGSGGVRDGQRKDV